jgi:hypothetical protein
VKSSDSSFQVIIASSDSESDARLKSSHHVSPDNRLNLADRFKSISGFNSAQRCDNRVESQENPEAPFGKVRECLYILHKVENLFACITQDVSSVYSKINYISNFLLRVG